MKLNFSNNLIDFSEFNGEELICNEGEFLFREGEKEEGVFFIHEGTIKVLNGKWVHWMSGPNEIVAISSFFAKGNRYIFSVKATKYCRITKYSCDDFQKMLSNYPKFSQAVIKSLCQRIEFTQKRVRSILWDNSWNRLLKELIHASYENPQINLSLEELSQLVGVSKRRVRTMLSDLEQKSILQKTKDQIEITDIKGLLIIAGSVAPNL